MEILKRMKSHKRMESDEYTIIIGCGRLGANLANALSDDGSNVLILDKDKYAFRKLSPSFGGLSITGDGTNLDTLQEIHIHKATVVVVVTHNDNTNVMIAQIAKQLFHVGRVITRLYDPEREFIHHEYAIDTICPAVLSASELFRILAKKESTISNPRNKSMGNVFDGEIYERGHAENDESAREGDVREEEGK